MKNTITEATSQDEKAREIAPLTTTRVSGISEWIRKKLSILGVAKYEYPPEDIDNWKSGAKKFQKFWKKVNVNDKGTLNMNGLGLLQAMFLREKPMMELPKKPMDENTIHLLKSLGYEFYENLLYDPNLVKKMIERYPDIFKNFGTNPSEVLMALCNEKQIHSHQERNFAAGLLFGFPFEAVKRYAQENGATNVNINADVVGKIIHQLQNLLSEEDRSFMFRNFGPVYALNPPDSNLTKNDVINFFKEKIRKYKVQLGIKEEEIEIIIESFKKEIERKSIDIYGIGWASYGTPSENEHERRFLDAFKISGITKNTKNSGKQLPYKHLYADERK